MCDFEDILTVLLDYYGNFECNSHIVSFLSQAEFYYGSGAGLSLTDNGLEGIAVDSGGPPVFPSPKNPADKGPYESE
ncbi:MAG: hypothetical protein LBH18_07795 [Spirochaetaceae bacterium]|jgi:hypothetical protein|nr:hypothetical protein [Spirochaetaceae bacterium]